MRSYSYQTCLLLFVFLTGLVHAQDAQYWTNAFGPKSALLSGAVVGGVKDFSASYYNAAGLALSDSTSGVSITSNAYNLENITLKNAAGKGKDLKSNNMQIIPLIITGKLKFKKNSRFSIGYFLVERQKSSFKSSARNTGFYNLVDNSISPGDEEYVAQYNSTVDLHEIAAGVSVAYKINEHYAVGLSNYGMYRTQKFITNYVARLAPTSDTAFFTSSYAELEDLEYKNIRTTIKLAFLVDYKNFKTGLTVTLPSINVWGSAVVGYDIAYSNVYLSGLNPPISLFADDRQELKKTVYKDPLSVAWGTEFKIGQKATLYLTAEWFAAVNTYTLVQPKSASFTKPSSANLINSADYLRVQQGRKSIINYAIGYEQKISKKINLLLGGRTNYYSLVLNKDDAIKLNMSYADLYHASLGLSYRRDKSVLYAGLLGGFGTKSGLKQIVNLNEPSIDSGYPMQGDLTDTRKDEYHSVSFMLGYVFFIK